MSFAVQFMNFLKF